MRKILMTPLLAEGAPIAPAARQVLLDITSNTVEKNWSSANGIDPMYPRRMDRVKSTYTEILAQPIKVRETITEERDAIMEAARHFAALPIDRLYLTGCGDSMAVMQGVQGFLEEVLDVPCEVVQALEFAYYRHHCVNERSLVIMLSSSGTTIRTLEAMYIAQAKGAQTLALTNTPGSLLMEQSTRGLLIHAQRTGWPTQSSTAAMAILLQLAIFMAQEKGYNAQKLANYQRDLDDLPYLMEKVAVACEEKVKGWAKAQRHQPLYLFSAAGPCYSAAFFGTAKVKECSTAHASLIPLEEFHHYNSVKVGEPLLILAPSGSSVPRAMDTLLASKILEANTFLITSQGEEELARHANDVLFLPSVNEFFCGLLYAIPAQLFGYFTSMEKYNDAKQATQS